MGYSHSWYRIGEIEAEVMDKIREDFLQILKELPEDSQIVDIPDYWGEPDDIAFGGVKGTCEPMIFCRVSQARKITRERAREPWMEGLFFEYCKTDNLPYDLPVQLLLIIAKNHLKDNIRVFSDGKYENWKNAINLCSNVVKSNIAISTTARELLL